MIVLGCDHCTGTRQFKFGQHLVRLLVEGLYVAAFILLLLCSIMTFYRGWRGNLGSVPHHAYKMVCQK
jgi:hypothetical protein